MIIDLLIYIENNLPIKLRKTALVEFIRVLILQVVKAHNAFAIEVPEWLYKANTNASVIALEHHINRQFGCDAVITELDGKPIDFLVSVNGFVNETQLKAFIDTYKLAGKSFVFKVGSVIFTAEWSGYRCEDIRETWTAEFMDYACVDDRQNRITVQYDGMDVTVTASRAVHSNIDVTVLIYEQAQSGQGGVTAVYIAIPNGATSGTATVQKSDYISYKIDKISPRTDDYYDYTY